MQKLLFFLGGFAIFAVFAVLFPVALTNAANFLFGGGIVHVVRTCDPSGEPCAFSRIETGLSLNDVEVHAVYASERQAARPNLIWRRIECDPGAMVGLSWENGAVTVSVSDGECQLRGTGDFQFPAHIVEK
jgi:hypothetical protein